MAAAPGAPTHPSDDGFGRLNGGDDGLNLSSTAGALSAASFLVMSLTPCFIFCHGTCIFPSVPDDVASPDVAGAPDLVGPRVGLGGGTAPPSARVEPSFGCRASRRSSSKDARGLLAAIIAAPIPPRSDMRAPNRARGKPLPPERASSVRRRLQPTNAAALAISFRSSSRRLREEIGFGCVWRNHCKGFQPSTSCSCVTLTR